METDLLKALFFQEWILSIWRDVTVVQSCDIGCLTKPIIAQNLGETIQLVIWKKKMCEQS